jgi:UDP-3-O-[3-hydroxymyristoyl] N-acetylglucosamine deacetylase
MFQTTLAGEVRVSGLGIHGGQAATMTLLPAPADSGVVFVRTDVEGERRPIPALADRVCDTRLATVIAEGGPTISTVEHIMAALAGLGVDNAVIEVDGPETPIVDGAAGDFVAAIDAVGVRTLDGAPRRYIEILKPIEVGQPGKRAALLPADRFEMSVEIIFDASAIGTQHLELAIDPASFRAEIASARTFGFIAEVEQLRAAGLGRGASLENTIVVDGAQVLNPEILARPDDFVRHKALDALGDLALFGHPILGRYEASCSGHALNNALVRAAMAQPDAWRLKTLTPEPA